jgi:hypothetical protein
LSFALGHDEHTLKMVTAEKSQKNGAAGPRFTQRSLYRACAEQVGALFSAFTPLFAEAFPQLPAGRTPYTESVLILRAGCCKVITSGEF